MTEVYKYFAYKQGDYWRVNELLPVSQIHGLLRSLAWKYEVFASIQSHDEDGNVLFAPLWFDFDGRPEDVLSEVRHFVAACEFVINCTPRIYFSGSKGFHLILERTINHPRVHELVADFAKEVGPARMNTLDPKVYRSRSMLRIPGSKASKVGYYKIEITRRELFDLTYDQIRQLATSQRFIETEHDPSKIDDQTFDAWLTQAIKGLPDHTSLEHITSMARSVQMEITPCIATMLAGKISIGERNMTVYVLAKFFRSCDIDEGTARDLLLRVPMYASFEQDGKEVSKVLRSVYRSPKPAMLGCRGKSAYAELMRTYCAAPCHFREDFDSDPFL